jgi:hypothetical protein
MHFESFDCGRHTNDGGKLYEKTIQANSGVQLGGFDAADIL